MSQINWHKIRRALHLQINSKRNNKDYVDKDYVVFAVTVGPQNYAAPGCSGTNSGYIGLASNGQSIPLSASDADPQWAIGPIPIDTDDGTQLFVSYTVTNLSFDDDAAKNAATAVKLVGDVLSVYGGLGSILATTIAGGTPLAALTGEVSQLLGSVLNLVSDVISAIVGTHQDCDGLVLTQTFPFSGASLYSAVSASALSAPPPRVKSALGSVVYSMTTTNAGLKPPEPPPGGCWTPNTNASWTVFASPDIESFSGGPGPGTKKSLIPQAAALSPQNWAGTWGDAQYTQNSRIACVINATGDGPTGESFSTLIRSYLSGLRYSFQSDASVLSLLGRDARQPRSTSFALPTVPLTPHTVARDTAATAPPTASPASSPPQAETTLVAPVTARYAVDVQEIVVGSLPGLSTTMKESATNLVEIPMLATLFVNDIYQEPVHLANPIRQPAGPLAVPATTTSERTLIAPDARDAVPAEQRAMIGQPSPGGTESASAPMSLDYAATLLVTNTISLQLYAERDPSGTIVSHRVRYSRTDGNGTIETDVMLAQTQTMPS